MTIALRALPYSKITYFKITLTLKTVLRRDNPCKLTNKMDCIYLLWKIKPVPGESRLIKSNISTLEQLLAAF